MSFLISFCFFSGRVVEYEKNKKWMELFKTHFENDFNISASGAISLADSSDPSPARLKEIRNRVVEESVQCVLAEPQYNKGLVTAVVEGTGSNTAIIDPLGVGLEAGPFLYEKLIRKLAVNLSKCF